MTDLELKGFHEFLSERPEVNAMVFLCCVAQSMLLMLCYLWPSEQSGCAALP